MISIRLKKAIAVETAQEQELARQQVEKQIQERHQPGYDIIYNLRQQLISKF